MVVQRLRDSPGDRPLVGDTHDEALLTRHQRHHLPHPPICGDPTRSERAPANRGRRRAGQSLAAPCLTSSEEPKVLVMTSAEEQTAGAAAESCGRSGATLAAFAIIRCAASSPMAVFPLRARSAIRHSSHWSRSPLSLSARCRPFRSSRRCMTSWWRWRFATWCRRSASRRRGGSAPSPIRRRRRRLSGLPGFRRPAFCCWSRSRISST